MLLRLLALVAFVIAASTAALRPAPVLACSLGIPPEDTFERLSGYMEYADVVVIAEITGSNPVPPNSGDFMAAAGTTTATFEPIALLYTEGPLQAFTIGPLRATGPDCSGGPKLQPGDKVLLFLKSESTYGVAAWSVGVWGDVIRFDGDEAWYVYPWESTEPAGTTRAVVETIVAITDPPAAAREAAFAFAGLPLDTAVTPAPAATTTPRADPSPAATSATPLTPIISPPDTGSAGLR